MRVYLYATTPTIGMFDLVNALGVTRLRKFDGMDFWSKGSRVEIKEGDIIICWGSRVPIIDGVRVLNAGEVVSPLKRIQQLNSAGVYSLVGHKDRHKEYIARQSSNTAATDILNPPPNPDFYVNKVVFDKEYVLHSFNGRSIRAGIKVPVLPVAADADSYILGKNAHPWVRSYETGWDVEYSGFQSDAKLKRIAHQAVKALGLVFGAVTLGDSAAFGKTLVINVEAAPRLQGGTVDSYVRAINRWIRDGSAGSIAAEPVAEDDDQPAPMVVDMQAPQPAPNIMFIPPNRINPLRINWEPEFFNQQQAPAVARPDVGAILRAIEEQNRRED